MTPEEHAFHIAVELKFQMIDNELRKMTELFGIVRETVEMLHQRVKVLEKDLNE